jgi:hypothetical protein
MTFVRRDSVSSDTSRDASGCTYVTAIHQTCHNKTAASHHTYKRPEIASCRYQKMYTKKQKLEKKVL